MGVGGCGSQIMEKLLQYHVRLMKAKSRHNFKCLIAEMQMNKSSIVRTLRTHVRSVSLKCAGCYHSRKTSSSLEAGLRGPQPSVLCPACGPL